MKNELKLMYSKFNFSFEKASGWR